jgi:hypothetical protein
MNLFLTRGSPTAHIECLATVEVKQHYSSPMKSES